MNKKPLGFLSLLLAALLLAPAATATQSDLEADAAGCIGIMVGTTCVGVYSGCYVLVPGMTIHHPLTGNPIASTSTIRYCI